MWVAVAIGQMEKEGMIIHRHHPSFWFEHWKESFRLGVNNYTKNFSKNESSFGM
jgi:hypothetical protein